MPDILELIQEAAAIACVDMTSGEAAKSAKRSIDLLSMEWSNKGLNLFTTDFQALNLVSGQPLYQLPLDTMDVLVASLRRTNTTDNTYIDLPLTRVDFAGYQVIPNKQVQGRVSQVFIHRKANPEMYVWQVPNDIPGFTQQIAYWRMRRIDDTGAYTNSCDIPYRFIPAMVAGLAVKLAMKSKDQTVMSRIPMLQASYNDTLSEARYEDRDRSSIFIQPMIW